MDCAGLLSIDTPIQIIQTEALRQLIYQMEKRALNMARENPG
jgi:hypothetical protein